MRMDNLQKLLPEQASRVPEGVDPFTIFYESQIQAAQAAPRQTGLLPSELVEFALLQCTEISSLAARTAAAIKSFCKKAANGVSKIDLLLYADDPEPAEVSAHEYETMADAEQQRVDENDTLTAPSLSRATMTYAASQSRLPVFTTESDRARSGRVVGVCSAAAHSINWLASKVNKFVYTKSGNIMLDALGTTVGVNHVIKCLICMERKVCNYRCSNDIIHPICQNCYSQLENPSCPVRCGHNVAPWLTDIPREDHLSKLVMWACVAAQEGAVLSQKFWNLLARFGQAMDVITIVLSVVWSAWAPLREMRQSTAHLNQYVKAYNDSYGTDYQVVPIYAGDNTRYYAISVQNPLNTMVLSGDALPLPPQRYPALTTRQYFDTFGMTAPADSHLILNGGTLVQNSQIIDEMSTTLSNLSRAGEDESEEAGSSSTPVPEITEPRGRVCLKSGGKTFDCSYVLSTLPIPVGTFNTPSVCIHRDVGIDWNYVRIGYGVGVWTHPRDDDKSAVDLRCPQGCIFDVPKNRIVFLHKWARLHFDDVVSLVQNKSWENTQSTVAPLDFLGDPVVESSWLSKFFARLSPKKWWEWLGERIGKVGRLLLIAGATVGVLVGANSLLSMTKMALSGYSSGRTVIAPHPRAPINPKVLAYSGGTVSEFDLKVGKLWKNVCWLHCLRTSVAETYCVKALMIRDRWCLITKHQLDKLCHEERNGAQVYFSCTRDSRRMPCQLVKAPKRQFQNHDLASVYLSPSTTTSFKSIIQFSNKKSDVSLARGEALIMEPRYDCGAFGMHSVTLQPGLARSAETQELEEELTRSYLYNGFSGRNSCGSLLLFLDNNTPLAGFHYVAQKHATNAIGGSVPLNSEILELLSPNSLSECESVPHVEEEKENPMVLSLSGDYSYEGHISSKFVPYQTHKSTIEKSLVSNTLTTMDVPARTEPACLSARDSRWKHDLSPLVSGCNKHCQPHRDFPRVVEDAVVAAAYADFAVSAKPVLANVAVRSVTNAVCGLLEHQEFPPIDMQTSVGWPFNTWKVKKQQATRENLLNPVRNESNQVVAVNLNPEFAAILELKQQMRKNGEVPATVFWDHLKDERRKPEKLRALGGTRIFSLSPLDFLIQHRQYYMDFTAAWHKNWFNLEHAVGIAPDGPDWSILATALLSVGSKIVCIDYSNFGPSLNARLASQIWDQIDKWYQFFGVRDDQIVRHVMKEEVIQPLHLCQDLLYRTYAGIPSGHPATTLLNTEVNKAQLKICWLSIAPPEYRTLESFRTHVKLFAYGDDGIFSVSDEVSSWFNGIFIANWFAKLNIKVTPATKDDKVVPFMKLSEATFLKRGFKKHPTRAGQWLAPLNEISIKDCAHWVNSKNSDSAGTQVNLDQSVRLAFGHGPEFFTAWRDKLNAAVATTGRSLQPILLDWYLLDDMFFSA